MTLNNVSATNIQILSGATNSIHLNNVKATNLSIRDTNNAVRVEITGTTAITNTKVESGAKLDVATGTTGSFGSIELAPTTAQNIELVNVTEVLTITKPVIVISETPINTKVGAGVEVMVKAKKEDLEGTEFTGKGIDKPAASINLGEVNGVMDQLSDNMLSNIPYPGDEKDENGKTTYSLATFVRNTVLDKITGKPESIRIDTGNYDENNPDRIPSGYYEVVLTIGGVTASKMIKVDTLTVDSAKTFKDALGYDINTLILKSNGTFIFDEPLHINKYVTIEGNENTLDINSGEGNVGEDNAAGLGILGGNVTLKNMTVTGNHKDNLIEIYSNATLKNVIVTGGNKAGIYVNNIRQGGITVNFKDIATSNNGWNAGIGLAAQEAGSYVTANFSGNNIFGEDVAVYDEGTNYLGIYNVLGLIGYEKTLVGNQNKWVKEEEVVAPEEINIFEKAKDYVYNDYQYVGISTLTDNSNEYVVESIYSSVGELLQGDAMNDMARYLGAIYRANDTLNLEGISYGGKNYVWDPTSAGNLLGSNWYNTDGEEGKKTLVAQITADILALVEDADYTNAIKSLNSGIEFNVDGVKLILRSKLSN